MFLAKKLNKGAGTPIVPADAQFNYVTMLLHGDGTNGGQNNTFLDSGPNTLSITRNGNTTQGSFSPYGSNWSNYFSDGAYLSVPNNAVFNPGSGDFTVEAMFVRTVNTGGSQTIIAKYESGWQASYSIVIAGDTWDVYITYGVGSYVLVYSGAAPAVGVWSHMALQRSGSYWEFYCNGVRLAQVTAYTIASTTSAIRIGELGAGYSGYSFNGHISNVRIRNGYATYSGSTYTVPTANLTAITGTVLLTCQSNRFIDNSSNNFTVTSGTVSTGLPSVQRFNPFGTSTAYSTSVIGGSGYFDGSGDYLTFANSSSFAFGTGNFTIEFFFYALSALNDKTIIDFRDNGSSNTLILTTGGYIGSAGSLRYASGSIDITSGSTLICNGAWNHCAIVRSGSTVTLYVNGTSTATGTDSSNFSITTGTNYIARNSYGGNEPTAYISNFRIVKGTAVYTAAFTPPTAPLTAITNTQLLLNMTNGAIFDNAMMNDLETVGNAQISTSVKKYGTGSIAFDGTGDCLKPNPASTDLYAFGSGNFTIEMWFYISAFTNTYNTLFDSRPVSTQGAYPTIAITSGRLYYYVSSAERIATANSTITTGQWYHLAVSRSGTSTKMFLDGTQVGSTYTDSTVYVNGTSRPVIGAEGFNSPPNDVINGYIDDLRITKGYARYTANFTAPTAALSDTGPY